MVGAPGAGAHRSRGFCVVEERNGRSTNATTVTELFVDVLDQLYQTCLSVDVRACFVFYY